MILFKINNRRGVTLVELLVAMALLTLVTGMIFSFFFQGTKIHSMGQEKAHAQQETSIAAFSITNTIRNVKEISLTDEPGYSQLGIQSRYPNITTIEYTIMKENGIYSLNLALTHQDGYSIESQVLLNNIKDADVGSTTTDIWFLNSDVDSNSPSISIGSSTGSIVEGLGGSVTYPISTANIENGENVQVSLNGTPSGLNITSTGVSNNSATITVTGSASVTPGVYTFSANYSGASERSGTVFVGQNIPVITLDGNSSMTIPEGSSFSDPGYSASDSKDGNITSGVVVAGDTVNKNSPGTYEITYNVTNSAGIPAVEVVRTVIVEAGPTEFTITFDSAGGSLVGSITKAVGESITAPEDPEKSGYTFTGWSPELPPTMPSENLTITAQYKEKTDDLDDINKTIEWLKENISLNESGSGKANPSYARNLPTTRSIDGTTISWQVEGNAANLSGGQLELVFRNNRTYTAKLTGRVSKNGEYKDVTFDIETWNRGNDYSYSITSN